MANRPRNSTVAIVSTVLTVITMASIYFYSLQFVGVPSTSKNLFVNGFEHMSELSAMAIFGWILLFWVVYFLSISLFVRIKPEEEGQD